VNRQKPLSFYFFGPTGVGKTETANALAHALDFNETNIRYDLVRFNMNEYQERHSAHRFVGAPPSYVGYGDTPLLFQAVQRNRHLVILLDEIEKAHPDILKTLMALMDTGQLSHASTSVADLEISFDRCIIVFTSNIKYRETIHPEPELTDIDSHEFQAQARHMLIQGGMLPEIVGRMGCCVLFSSLKPDDLLLIVADKIRGCAFAFGLRINRLSPLLVADIATKTVSSSFGVRTIEQLTEQIIAPKILDALRENPQLDEVEIAYIDEEVVVLPESHLR